MRSITSLEAAMSLKSLRPHCFGLGISRRLDSFIFRSSRIDCG